MAIRPSDQPWQSPASLRRNGLRWLFLPLVAFAIFSAGPSILALILYILHIALDLIRYIGSVKQGPSPVSLILEPLVLALAVWPFLALYGIARARLVAQPLRWRSTRLATIGATLAMAIPCTVFLIGTPAEMLSSVPDAGQGTGIMIFLLMFLLPILGAFGWLSGRGVSWLLGL
jgi:hypothetical protein